MRSFSISGLADEGLFLATNDLHTTVFNFYPHIAQCLIFRSFFLDDAGDPRSERKFCTRREDSTLIQK